MQVGTKHAARMGWPPCPAASSESLMKSIVLWLLGVPISLIVLLKLFGVF